MLTHTAMFLFGMWFGWRLPIGLATYKARMNENAGRDQAALAGLKAMAGF